MVSTPENQNLILNMLYKNILAAKDDISESLLHVNLGDNISF